MKKYLPFLFLLLFINCNKDDNSDPENEEATTELQENVVIISKESSHIISTESELTNGIYKIQFSQSPPQIKNGDVIVGDENEGFLRKGITVSVDGNVISMQTEQANMEQLFKNATIEFSNTIEEGRGIVHDSTENIKINYLAEGMKISANGLNYDFSNTVLYQDAGLTFEITNGTASFEPNFQFKSDYTLLGGLTYFIFGTDNANLNIDCDLNLNATAGINLPEFTKPLASYDKTLIVGVAGVPVTIVVSTTLEAKLNANISSEFNIASGFTNTYTLSTGIKKENGTWSSNFDLTPTLTPKPVTMEGQVNIAQSFAIVPRVSIKFFGVIGPFCEPALVEDFAYNIASPSLDWDSNIQVGVDLKTGVEIEIFGFGDDYSITNHFKDTIWSAPKHIVKISGDNQHGDGGQQLPQPIKVRVTDELNMPLENVPIYFQVSQCSGSVLDTSVLTDENGFAETLWTLGNVEEPTIEVFFKDHTETIITDALQIFRADAEVEELVNQIKLFDTCQILDFNNLPFSEESEYDDVACFKYAISLGLNKDGVTQEENSIEIHFYFDSPSIPDGTYLFNTEIPVCENIYIFLYHSDIFGSYEIGLINTGTVTFSNNGTEIDFTGELIKGDAIGGETTSLGMVTGRIIH